MSVNILMPALSPTMEKGNLAKWLKKEGDKVKPGDVIAEIETDKATMEYEAVDEGTLAKIVVPEGTQDVPVNQLIPCWRRRGRMSKRRRQRAQPALLLASQPQVQQSPRAMVRPNRHRDNQRRSKRSARAEKRKTWARPERQEEAPASRQGQLARTASFLPRSPVASPGKQASI